MSGPDTQHSSSVPLDSGPEYFLQSGSEPLDMKLFSELWTCQIQDSDPLPKAETQLPGPLSFPGLSDRSPPSTAAVVLAIARIDSVLQPPRSTRHGY